MAMEKPAESRPDLSIVVPVYNEIDNLQALVDRVRAIGQEPALLKAILEADRADREARRPELEAEARRLRAERDRLDAERKNVVDAIAKGSGVASHVLVQRLRTAARKLRHERIECRERHRPRCRDAWC